MGGVRSRETSSQRGTHLRFPDEKRERVERTTCEEPGCGRSTRASKPFCTQHVDQHPYARALVEQLEEQDAEIEKVRREGSRVVDPKGLTCREVLQWLRVHGPRTLPRLAREIQVDTSVLGHYVVALASSGMVCLVKSVRRGPIVQVPTKNEKLIDELEEAGSPEEQEEPKKTEPEEPEQEDIREFPEPTKTSKSRRKITKKATSKILVPCRVCGKKLLRRPGGGHVRHGALCKSCKKEIQRTKRSVKT